MVLPSGEVRSGGRFRAGKLLEDISRCGEPIEQRNRRRLEERTLRLICKDPLILAACQNPVDHLAAGSTYGHHAAGNAEALMQLDVDY